MKFWSDNFKDGEKIPKEFAFIKRSGIGHFSSAKNHNPRLGWSELPEGTKSLVLIMHDMDAPSSPKNANQEGKTLAFDLPRADFFHWVLVDLAPGESPIQEAEFSDQVTPHGKSAINGPRETRQGVNDFGVWYNGDKDMEGNYFGYDGPAPPWNDERTHRYVFTLYALKVKHCPARGILTGPSVLKAIEGLVLGKAQFTGTYSINPKAKPDPRFELSAGVV
jgi:Raf kinase inhibitor-like YbhB/YbcL family protein